MQLTSLLPAALVPTAFSLVPSHMQLCPAAENRPRRPSYDSEASAPPPLPGSRSGPLLPASYLIPKGERASTSQALCLSYPQAGPKLLEGKVHESLILPDPHSRICWLNGRDLNSDSLGVVRPQSAGSRWRGWQAAALPGFPPPSAPAEPLMGLTGCVTTHERGQLLSL